jgi:hypothetical protein
MAKREKKINASESKVGVKSPGVQTGKVDPVRSRIAANGERRERIASGQSTGMFKNAGMMMTNSPNSSGTWGSGSLPAFRSSYASGNTMVGSGTADIPPYFQMMNDKNGGLIYWPVSLREKYEWYRYFARTDAFIGRGLELLSDLPMSRISLNMPKMEKKKKLKDEIYSFFSAMCENLGLFKRLQDGLWEYNLIGNAYFYHEWNQKKKMWDRIVILPPEEVSIFQYPYQDNSRVEYRPEKLIQLIRASEGNMSDADQFTKNILDGIPKEIVNMVLKEDCIVMDSAPIIDGKVGSFVYHMARRRSPYMDLGASVLERVLVPMLMKEHFRYTQLGLASRNMTPKNKISAPNLTEPELNDLRVQLDLSYMDPDYSIVTNYEWDWEQIGADGRLLDLQGEYEMIENQVFAAMGVTRELMTGEGTWSGNRITIEIINTMFLLTREMLREYVENYLFRPVAIANGWFEEDKNGVREYFYPKLGFNRLSIRDNAEVFDSLFQLYQKGSLPIDVIYELFNLDSESLHNKMRADLFTIKDPTFNRLVEQVNGDIGSKLVESTDIAGKVAEYLGLKMTAPVAEDGGVDGGFGGGFGEEEQQQETSSDQPAAEGESEDGGFDLSSLDDILVDEGSKEE